MSRIDPPAAGRETSPQENAAMTLSAVFTRCFATTEVTQPAKLYRELCRHIKTLPKEAQLYYRNHVRQNFSNFTEEADPETLQRLFARAREDAAWVVNKAKMQRQQQQRQAGLQELAAGVGSTVLWMAASSSLIIFNKALYDNGFPFPQMVTGFGQVFSALGGLLLAVLGIMPLHSPPKSPADAMRLLPIVACTAATMYFGNAAYMHLSMSFIQILKAFTPGLTLLIGAACRVERLTLPLVMAVLLIAIGTGGAVLAESGAPAYSVLGVLLFLASSVTEAGRVVASQLLLGPYNYNSAEVLVYVGSPSALVLIVGSLLTERQHGMLEVGRVLLATQPQAFLKAFGMSCIVNLTSYLAIATSSSLTFKVAGCLKNLGVVWYGVAVHGDHVTSAHMLGYGVSIAGFVLYTVSRRRPAAAATPAAGGSPAAKKAT